MGVVDISVRDPASESRLAPLQVRSLGKRYGDQRVLLGISFNASQNEVIGLIGPNRAGKTTLLEALAGILPADTGEVIWRGTPLAIRHRREVMFYLPDGLRTCDDQYVVRVVAFVSAVYGRPEWQRSQIIQSLELTPVLRKRVSALSKGFARRLMLALALLTHQPLLLMDEPFDGFDLRQTREVMALIRREAAGGRTLVLAIHQLADAERVCDRFVLLADGAVRGIGTLDELRA